MIKRILLKLAHWIYKHYDRTIEIEPDDFIKFNGGYYRIAKLNLIKEIGCVDVLDMELHDISDILKEI